MLRLFRVRAWCLATALFLATGTAGASFELLLHSDAAHHADPCAAPVLVAHDAAAHRVTVPPDDRADEPGTHCLTCHLARALRLRSESSSFAAHDDDARVIRVPS